MASYIIKLLLPMRHSAFIIMLRLQRRYFTQKHMSRSSTARSSALIMSAADSAAVAYPCCPLPATDATLTNSRAQAASCALHTGSKCGCRQPLRITRRMPRSRDRHCSPIGSAPPFVATPTPAPAASAPAAPAAALTATRDDFSSACIKTNCRPSSTLSDSAHATG